MKARFKRGDAVQTPNGDNYVIVRDPDLSKHEPVYHAMRVANGIATAANPSPLYESALTATKP